MNKKKNFLQYLRWVQNKQARIEKQKRRKKKRGTNRPLKAGIKHTIHDIRIVFPEVIDMYNPNRCEETKWYKGYLDFNNIENDGDYIKYSIQLDHSSIKKQVEVMDYIH